MNEDNIIDVQKNEMKDNENIYNEPMQNGGINYNQSMQNDGMNYNQPMQNGGINYNQPMQSDGMNYNQPMQNGGINYNQPMQNDGMNYNQPMQNGGVNYNQPMQNGGMNYNQPMQNGGMNYNQPMQNSGVNYNQQFGNGNNIPNEYSNYGTQQQGNGVQQENEFDEEKISQYKQILRQDKEVQSLTSQVNIDNPNSIIMFGQGASENISRVSDQLLNSIKSVKSEEVSEMLNNLTKIMDKFDVKELEGSEKKSFFNKLLKGIEDSISKLFEKYETMGTEVDKVYVLLRRYESEIREANNNLKKLYEANIEYYRALEKYIVAGEMAVEEVDRYIGQVQGNNGINDEQRQMMVQKLETAKDMLAQRVYDLQIAENVAIQAAPMIQTIQMSNFNLMRKINSSFIVTLPIFKQCLAQAIILKRQEIQAKSIKQLDEKTNELIMRNANNTARQSVEIAKMTSGSSISISTLEKSYETIMKGISDTKEIQESNKQKRIEDSKKLEVIKYKMKQNIALE